jgi:hypothetical protein
MQKLKTTNIIKNIDIQRRLKNQKINHREWLLIII